MTIIDETIGDRNLRSMAATQPDALLTEAEHAAMKTSADLYNQMSAIIDAGPAWAQDLAEAAQYIHVLQRMILAQAAARAFPDRYRALGGDAPGTTAAGAEDETTDAEALSRLTELVRSDAQPNESAVDTTIRLLEELGRRRQADNRRILAENWGDDGDSIYATVVSLDGADPAGPATTDDVEYQTGGER